MSLTKTAEANELAGALFDEVVIPLAAARESRGQRPYFERSGKPDAETYFEPATTPVMQPLDFEFPGGGTPEGLVDALVAYWTQQGDDALAPLAEGLKELARAYREEDLKSDGTVDVLCYTMF